MTAMTRTTRAFWDDQAATFDDEPDHGLLDPAVWEAWWRLLAGHLPAAPADVLDPGCGTGTLSVLLAEQGYAVRGCDYSPAMVNAAREKAARAGVHDVGFVVADAARPPYATGSCDVVLVRHLLWAMPDPDDAVARWVDLLRPGGRLLLVEGHWATGGGVPAADAERIVRRHRDQAEVLPLIDPQLWGREITDERYLLVSTH
jgi:SAM-dependent methyltransferase